MPRPPRPPGGSGGGRFGIGGGPYRRQSTFGMRGVSDKVGGYDRYSGSGWVAVDQYGIPVSAPRRGGGPSRKPRPPITQQTGPSPRERVAKKIASKIMEREKFTSLLLSTMKQAEAQQAALDAAKRPSHLADSVRCRSWWGSLSGWCRTSCGNGSVNLTADPTIMGETSSD